MRGHCLHDKVRKGKSIHSLGIESRTVLCTSVQALGTDLFVWLEINLSAAHRLTGLVSYHVYQPKAYLFSIWFNGQSHHFTKELLPGAGRTSFAVKKGKLNKWGYDMLRITSRHSQTSSVALTPTFLTYSWENKHLSKDTEWPNRSGPALSTLYGTAQLISWWWA